MVSVLPNLFTAAHPIAAERRFAVRLMYAVGGETTYYLHHESTAEFELDSPNVLPGSRLYVNVGGGRFVAIGEKAGKVVL